MKPSTCWTVLLALLRKNPNEDAPAGQRPAGCSAGPAWSGGPSHPSWRQRRKQRRVLSAQPPKSFEDSDPELDDSRQTKLF
jgi:hypothetical protein